MGFGPSWPSLSDVFPGPYFKKIRRVSKRAGGAVSQIFWIEALTCIIKCVWCMAVSGVTFFFPFSLLPADCNVLFSWPESSSRRKTKEKSSDTWQYAVKSGPDAPTPSSNHILRHRWEMTCRQNRFFFLRFFFILSNCLQHLVYEYNSDGWYGVINIRFFSTVFI